MLRVLPVIAEEKIFALKGGTAINLFLRNMPRLSVDIDLTYLPRKGRAASLQEIGSAIKRIKHRVERALKGSKVVPVYVSGGEAPSSFVVQTEGAQIKGEVNLILRGFVFPGASCELCKKAQEDFALFVETGILSIGDLYAGKLCAAMDRQHPRDFFDLKILLENEGITEEIRRAFVVYLASHSRPINELLDPNWKDISDLFKRDFEGMTEEPVTPGDLLNARDEVLAKIRSDLSTDERRFLISMKEGEPDWSAIGIEGIEKLPGLQWKLINVRKMGKAKRETEVQRLKKVLDY